MSSECRAHIIAKNVPSNVEYIIDYKGRRHINIPHPNSLILVSLGHGAEVHDNVIVTIVNSSVTPPLVASYTIPEGTSSTLQITSLVEGPSALEVIHPNIDGNYQVVLQSSLSRRG